MRIPLIWIGLCLAACAGIESDIIRRGPQPPVERFPARPYVAPPTPQEKAEVAAAAVAAAEAAAAMRAARAERRAAISNLLASVGIVEKPDADAKEIAATAARITAAAEVVAKEAQILTAK